MQKNAWAWVASCVLAVGACGGTRVPVGPEFAAANQERVVSSVRLKDARVITFDRGETAGAGEDGRARIQGEFVEGSVDGNPVRVALSEVEEVTFGMEFRPGPEEGSKSEVIVGLAFAAVALSFLAFVMAMQGLGGIE